MSCHIERAVYRSRPRAQVVMQRYSSTRAHGITRLHDAHTYHENKNLRQSKVTPHDFAVYKALHNNDNLHIKHYIMRTLHTSRICIPYYRMWLETSRWEL